MDEITFDREHALQYLTLIYEGLPGLINVVSTGDWRGRFFPTDSTGLRAASIYTENLDTVRQPQGVYVRTTTLSGAPKTGRGLAEHTLEVPMLWGDVDYGTDGHKGSKLPPHSIAAEAMIKASGLPDPTLMVHSGGGLYPLWVFAERPEPELAAKLSEGVQQALAVAHERHGFTYGTGVGDLARVLRLPGSVNRKLPNEPRACYVEVHSGALVTPDMFPTVEPVKRPAPKSSPRASASSNGRRGPFDALADTASWADIFEPAGWTFVKTERSGAELWLRPGGADSEYSARAFEFNVVIHSEAAGLPSGAGQKLTKARLFAHLHHAGDESEAACDLIAASRGEGCTEAAAALPKIVLSAIREACPSDDGHVEIAASPEELASWLDIFTSNQHPERLVRRYGWMTADSPSRLPRHTLHLIAGALAGDFPAEHAVRALVAAHQHHGGSDPAHPRRLLSVALGAVLNAAVSA
ncbi:MAG: hypothetical protein ACRDRY_17815 [Pseudonocardiaceae bacterium]